MARQLEFTVRTRGGRLRYRNASGPITSIELGGRRRTRLRLRLRAAALGAATAGDLTVDLRIGGGVFAQDVTLEQKRGALVGS